MTTKLPPHEGYLTFAEELADQVRDMLLTASALDPDIEIKADASYVTATDKAIEAALREMIAARHPDHGILGEEFESTNVDAEFVWVLDPIDGTAPFVAGIPVFGSLIGLAWKGAPYLGVIEHPMTRDRWVGVADTMARFNGHPIRTRPCASIETALVTGVGIMIKVPSQWHLRGRRSMVGVRMEVLLSIRTRSIARFMSVALCRS